MYEWVQRVIFFFNLNVFRSGCADLISASSPESTVALLGVWQTVEAEENQIQCCSGLFPHLSLSFIHLSLVNLLMFSVSGLAREAILCASV